MGDSEIPGKVPGSHLSVVAARILAQSCFVLVCAAIPALLTAYAWHLGNRRGAVNLIPCWLLLIISTGFAPSIAFLLFGPRDCPDGSVEPTFPDEASSRIVKLRQCRTPVMLGSLVAIANEAVLIFFLLLGEAFQDPLKNADVLCIYLISSLACGGVVSICTAVREWLIGIESTWRWLALAPALVFAQFFLSVVLQCFVPSVSRLFRLQLDGTLAMSLKLLLPTLLVAGISLWLTWRALDTAPIRGEVRPPLTPERPTPSDMAS